MPTDTHLTPSAPHGSRRCRCGARYGDASLRGLRVVGVLADDDLARTVMRWPAGTTVELRACARCGQHVARLARSA